MPKPYHTPKSDRDEEIGALTEAEEIAEAVEEVKAAQDAKIRSAAAALFGDTVEVEIHRI
jgi:hypothetical protein